MKKSIYLLLLVPFLFVACGDPQPENDADVTDDADVATEAVAEPTAQYIGEETSEEGAISVADLIMNMGDEKSIDAKITAEVTSVCQNKGCWLTIPKEGGDIRVTFKDYGFFVPMDCAGQKVVLDGVAYLDTMSVELLQHYAEDEGQTEEEVQAITEPEITLAFEAKGVILFPR